MLRTRLLNMRTLRTLGGVNKFNTSYGRSYCSSTTQNEKPQSEQTKKITLNITLPSLSCKHFRDVLVDASDNIFRKSEQDENYKYKFNEYIFGQKVLGSRAVLGYAIGFITGGSIFLMNEYHTTSLGPLGEATCWGIVAGVIGGVLLALTPITIPICGGITVLVLPLYVISDATKKPYKSRYDY